MNHQHNIVLDKLFNPLSLLEFYSWSGQDPPSASNHYDIDCFICFNGADYIAHLWSTLINSQPQPQPAPQSLNGVTWSMLSNVTGVFKCHVSIDCDGRNIEEHSFVLWISEEYVHVYNSYGGHPSFIYCYCNKEAWFTPLVDFSFLNPEDQRNKLQATFGLPSSIFKSNYNTERFRGKPISINDLSVTKVI